MENKRKEKAKEGKCEEKKSKTEREREGRKEDYTIPSGIWRQIGW
jgi:hypothetical protein